MTMIIPGVETDAFDCPHCGAFAQQRRFDVSGYSNEWGNERFEQVKLSVCTSCSAIAIWLDNSMVWPASSTAPLPNNDLPDDIKKDYEEAAAIMAMSPRGAAALLRLCVQKLCIALGQDGKTLDADIGALVKQGLLPQVQQSLDAVRVVGNNAVHPGELSVDDNPDLVAALFRAVNLIAEQMISTPRESKELYDSLPQRAKARIEERDS